MPKWHQPGAKPPKPEVRYDPAEVHVQVLPRPRWVIAAFAAGFFALPQQTTAQMTAQNLNFALFERYLDSLRQQASIPGVSGVIVQDGRVAWEIGLGFADVERHLPARPDTPYPIADLTQTFASVLLLQCAERGSLDLDDPLTRWSVAAEGTIYSTLAHTGPNGNGFRYDPARFSLLTRPVDACGGGPARGRVATEVFERLGMIDSVPGTDLANANAAATATFTAAQLERYERVLSRMAVPYRVDRRGRAARADQPARTVDASSGIVSTARDLARYDAALDDRVLLRDDALRTMWSNVSPTGASRPTGLGWFVQHYNGQQLIWHFGYAQDAYSSLILKVPGKRLTLILLANSDRLSAGFDLARGDVTSSLFAATFLRLFP
jgi:CubicO group peptidase (beta-lactamase class C family)